MNFTYTVQIAISFLLLFLVLFFHSELFFLRVSRIIEHTREFVQSAFNVRRNCEILYVNILWSDSWFKKVPYAAPILQILCEGIFGKMICVRAICVQIIYAEVLYAEALRRHAPDPLVRVSGAHRRGIYFNIFFRM